MMKEDWIECKIGDIYNFIGGGTPSKNHKEFWNGDIPWASIKDIKGKYLEATIDTITGAGLENSASNLASYGDVILATRINPGKGIICKVTTAINQDLKVVKPKLTISNLYTYYLFRALEKEIIRLSSGTTVLGINLTILNDINIVLPPLPIQRAIVKKVEQLFSALDAGIADLKKAQEQLNLYRQAVLKKAFEGELTKKWRNKNEIISAYEFLTSVSKARLKHNYKKGSIYHKKLSHDFNFCVDPNIPTWARSTLDKLVYIAARIGWRGLKKDEYKKDGPLFLSVHSLNHGKYVDYREAFHLSTDRYNESPEIQLKEGDVLLCKDGAGIGKLGIVKDLPNRATVNSSILVIRGMEILNQEFLYYLFVGPDLQKIVFERITGSATPHLFQNDIRQFELSIPPPEEQLQIVKEIESRLSVCDALEQQINTSLQQSEALRHSILKNAFDGELLTEAEIVACKNERDYEPASVLLEKIIAETTKAKTKDKKITAQPEVEHIVANTPKVSADIHAGLIAKIIKLHEAHSSCKGKLSHVKCEKIAHLVEYHAQVPLGRQPVKDAAGPDDYPHLKKVESRAIKAGFFKIKKNNIGYTYLPGKYIDKVIEKFELPLSIDQRNKVDALLQLFLHFDLEQAEIAATVYAGWNNLIILGNSNPSDEEIVSESRENWSARKLSIPRERFFKAINWLRRKEVNLIPRGHGLLVSAPVKKKK